MEHISLYRKWRPQSFSEVVGQRHVTETLANALSSGRIVHAYLFAGPRGTGKTSTARILAKAINCVNGPTANPCNECDACVSISEGTALDVIEIDAASNRKIDEIRDLLEKIPYTPTMLRSKVYIVDEIHQLSPDASSALLKTLEEPPGHVVFILATTEPHKLLPTIVSRCQRFDFSLVSAQDLVRLLEHIASRERIDVDAEALGMVAEKARGSVRDAIGVMDQISNLPGERVTREQLADLIGEVETDLVFRMVDMIAERDTPAALALIADLVEAGKDPRRFLEALIAHLRNLFLIQNASHPDEIVEVTSEHFQRLGEQSNLISRHEVIKTMERLGETHREMRWSESPRLVLECAIVKNTSLDADVSLEGLAFRIEELERRMEALGGPRSSAPDDTHPPGPAAKSSPPRPAGRGAKAAAAAGDAAAAEAPSDKGNGPRPAGAGSSEREKVRRGWMAVLAELKKAGQMKLYALLARVKVQGAAGGKLVLGFPEDAVFQMEVLADSEDDIAAIKEAWARFMDESVEIELVSLARGPARRPSSTPAAPGKAARHGSGEETGRKPSKEDSIEEAAEKPAAKADGKGGGSVKGGGSATASSPAGKAGGQPAAEKETGEPPGETGEGAGSQAVPDDAGGKKISSREVAQRLKERFDGEIVEENKEKE